MSVTEAPHSVGDILRLEHHGLLLFLSKKSSGEIFEFAGNSSTLYFIISDFC